MRGMNGKLPPGWEMATLDDLGTWTGGGTPSKKVADYWGGDIPWVTPKDMKAPRLNGSQDRITAKAVQESSAKLVPAGSLAFVVRSGILEHTLPIALLKCDATINQDLKVLTPHADLNPEWLLYALLALAPMIRRECRKDGTTVASLDFPKLRRYPVPLPPRAEQDRIVEAIEEISALVDDADAALGATLRLIEAYVGRGLRDLFWAQDGRPRWETRPLGEICGTSSGGTPSRKERSHFGGDIPWIKIGDLNDGVVTKTEESLTAEGLESSSASLLPAGTLLIAMYGASIGRLGISGMEAATNQAICAFKPNSDVVLRDYLYWFLRASRRDLVRAGYGGAQPNLSQKYIRSIQVPLPSISEQANVVARARQTAEAATQTREAVKRVQEQATTLRRSLLHRAMTGQLVPQYSSDEPASELLSRIQAEKAELKQRIGTARKATSGHQQAA